MNLAAILKSAGVSREAAADIANVSKQSIDNWCSGRTVPKLDHVSKLASVLIGRAVSHGDLRSWISSELMRNGLEPNTLRLLGDFDIGLMDQPVFVIGSGAYTASYQTLALGIKAEAKSRGITNVVFLDTCGRREILDCYLNTLLQSQMYGAVLVSLPLEEIEFAELASGLSKKTACVFVQNGPGDLPDGCGFVTIGNEEAAAICTEMLWEKGHKSIAAIAIQGGSGRHGQLSRAQGYENAMTNFGGESRVVWASEVAATPTFSAPADLPELREAVDLIVEESDIDAFLPLSSHAAKELVHALHRKDLMPGRDVTVAALGCWDWMHHISSPPLSHLALPYFEAGKQASRMLSELASDADLPSSNVVTIDPKREMLHSLEHGTISNRRARN